MEAGVANVTAEFSVGADVVDVPVEVSVETDAVYVPAEGSVGVGVLQKLQDERQNKITSKQLRLYLFMVSPL